MGIDRRNASLIFNRRNLISHFGHFLMLFSNELERQKLRTIVAALRLWYSVWELVGPSMIPNKEKENLVIAGAGTSNLRFMNMYKLLIEGNTDMTVTAVSTLGRQISFIKR